jgi:hypothetical protein
MRNKKNIPSHLPYKRGEGNGHSAFFLPLSFALSPFGLMFGVNTNNYHNKYPS